MSEPKDAYDYLGPVDAWHPAIAYGLTIASTDADLDRIASALLTEFGDPPFDAQTLGPALATWRDDMEFLEETAR